MIGTVGTPVAAETQAHYMSVWASAVEQALEQSSKVKPKLSWARSEGRLGTDDPHEWWEADYEGSRSYHVWIGVPGAAAELDRLAEAVAGAGDSDSIKEDPTITNAMESISQSFGSLLSSELGETVRFQGLKRLDGAPPAESSYVTTITVSERNLPSITVGFDIQRAEDQGAPAGVGAPEASHKFLDSQGALSDLDLPLSVRFGRVKMPLEEVLDLRVGSLVELEGSHNEPVDLIVNGTVVARGEVVAVGSNYGVRILEMVSHAGT